MRERRFGNLGATPAVRIFRTSRPQPPPPPAPAFTATPPTAQPMPARAFKVSRPQWQIDAPKAQAPPLGVASGTLAGGLPVVNLVTAVSRPGNLPRIYRSAEHALSRSGMAARWIIVVDGPDALPAAVESEIAEGRLEVKKIVHGGGACPYGIAQKNLGMDAISDGYYHCLDDDNVVHPDFFSALERAARANPGRRAFVFGQRRWDSIGNLVASPQRMRLGHIDNTMFVVHSSMIGGRRYDLAKAGSEDFSFFVGLYEAHRDEFVFLPETAAYYNFIRHFPDETPEETARRRRPSAEGAPPDRAPLWPRAPGVLRVALYSSKRERCGISTYTSQLEDALASMGHDVRHWGSRLPQEPAFEEMQAWRPDVFHIQYEASIMPPEATLAAYSDLVRQDGTKVLVTLHTADAGALKVARRVTGGAVGAIVAHLAPPGAQDVVVMPMPCTNQGPLTAPGPARRRFGLPEGAFVVSTVGFMIPWKDHPRIAESMVPWLLARPDVHLQIIASEHFNEGLREYARACRAELAGIASLVPGRRVHHVDGYPSDREVVERLAASDLGYIWCPFDTTSSSAAGAQFTSARCPLVATDSSHYASLGPGVIHGPKSDMRAFVALVRKTAEDPGLLARLRAGQWETYRERNYLESARAHLLLYGRPR